ncbi:MAG: VanZ family protein [candidate division KSB1 bacterium]|nr:VanZ family protein [candidate division KSB1 bacterium]MDZ7333576.1 VanZ family protein [candidate division KSB1 bacterium]MDZ7357021.1 VanZ family protein [candidate division KSB1 bacterium]MDZ7377158.1 VanZ family protein [candidate division KSB1 bacterium]MDZ7398690.1 VanZ family protein [candidate division KSB1 bacterium]
MSKFKLFLWFQGPAIAWALAIFIQSSISYLNAPDLGFDWQDKFYHALEYAILALLVRRALIYQPNFAVQHHANWWTIAIASFYAISDEIHQYFVPGRSADLSDVAADIIGSTLVVSFYFAAKQLRQRRIL